MYHRGCAALQRVAGPYDAPWLSQRHDIGV